MKIRQSAGKSYAYLLGVYLGDGCITASAVNPNGKQYPIFRLNTIDEDFAEATKQAIQAISEYPVSIHKHDVKKSKNPNYALACHDPELCRNLVMDTAAKEILPEAETRDEKLSLISGLMDSEGFVAASRSRPIHSRYYMGYKSCDIWVPEFIKLLESVGIKIGKVSQENPRKPGYKPPTRFHIKIQSWIDSGAKFNISRKQNRVNEWLQCRLTPTTNTPDTAR